MWNTLKKETCCVYVRVSHEDQVQAQGLEYQEKLCRDLCEYKGYDIYNIYIEEGISGTVDTYERKEMKKLLDDARTGKFQNVVTFSIDRVSRRGDITMNFYETLKDLGITFITCKERIDSTTHRGKFLLSVFAYASEMELAISKERAAFGREHRRLKDGECGGRITYGYTRVDKTLTMNLQHAAIIKAIYNAYYETRISMNKIAKILTEEEIPTPRNGKKWNPSTVSNILSNNYKKYRGCIVNNNINNVRWPVILDKSYDD